MITFSVVGFICSLIGWSCIVFVMAGCLVMNSDRRNVNHARWVKEEDRTNHWHCSHCKHVEGIVSQYMKYCPNCGWRMVNIT